MSKHLFILVTAVAVTLASTALLRADPTPGRARWEYKAEQLPTGTKEGEVAKTLEARLAALTEEGWEYAGWVPTGNTYLLRRAR